MKDSEWAPCGVSGYGLAQACRSPRWWFRPKKKRLLEYYDLKCGVFEFTDGHIMRNSNCWFQYWSNNRSFWLTWKPMWVFCPEAMYFPLFETVMQEMSLSCPLKKLCFLEIMWRTTMVVPSGKIMCSLSGWRMSPSFTLPIIKDE